MTSYSRDGKVGIWAREKLECLGNYLSAYSIILKEQKWCEGYFYIDAFAGAGRTEIRKSTARPESDFSVPLLPYEFEDFEKEEDAEYVEGSPHVALNIDHPFTRYFLIDLDLKRISRLEALKTEYGDTRNINVLHGEASTKIESIVNDPQISWQRNRAVAFLDPFGMQVNWKTIQSLASTNAIEVIINLPVGMAIQRYLERSGDVSLERRARLDDYFGDPGWYDIVYEEQFDLLGPVVTKRSESGHRLARWYQQRLKSIFGFSSPARLIRNSKGGHLYYLIWAGPNGTGAKIASYVLNQGEAV